MKVNLHIDRQIQEPYADIHADRLTDMIQAAASHLQNLGTFSLIGEQDGKFYPLEPSLIYRITIEDRKTYAHLKTGKLLLRKRLYEMEELLSDEFIKISKSVLINKKLIKCVEPSFQGILVVMKNDTKDYISRTYLKDFKSRLGIDQKGEPL